ncbi:MAG: RluA family pseudouridine synthase [Planctomycetes bacterium]|nr:RluA family pseudouridine synthase [Planctomycetota bacterium]MCG2685652.1 RluA family pseudouridine synthase [Planctomycetales bacterium]
MNTTTLKILYEDNHLLVVNKPAMLPTMGTPGDRPTLLTLAKQYVKRRYRKPGNVYLGVMSRLDAPTSGVVLLARTSKAARRLTEQFRTHAVDKLYWALVEGAVEPASGNLVDWLGQDDRHRRMHVVGATLPGAKEARLSYQRLSVQRGYSLLEVRLETGRKHQIRLQMAHRGHPVVGDRKYGGSVQFPDGIALHARRLVVSHPTSGVALEFVAPPPGVWRRFGIGLPK